MFHKNVICRYLAGVISKEENRKLEQWQEQDIENKQIVKDYRAIWKLSAVYGNNTPILFDSQIGWVKLKSMLSKRKTKSCNSKEDKKQQRINKMPSKIKRFMDK